MELKLLLTYNIRPNRETEYYRFVLGEFLPSLQNIGLIMVDGWHTAYGDYPIRLIVFQTQDETEMHAAIKSKEWLEGKDTLLKMVTDYEERLVPARNVFQFFIPNKPKDS